MASVLDDAVIQSINSGLAVNAAGASESRGRGYDMAQQALATALANYVSAPSVMAGQGIRMLSGTPGQFANAVPAGSPNVATPGP